MTATDFIIKCMDELVLSFPNIRARYENHELSNTHFVEVVPNEVYAFNEDYRRWEEEIVFRFIEKFPTQNLCFITDDAIVGIEKVDYQSRGTLFNLVYSVNTENCHVVEITNIRTSGYKEQYSHILANQQVSVVSEVADLNYKVSRKYLNEIVGIKFYDTDHAEIFENAGETNYANAA